MFEHEYDPTKEELLNELRTTQFALEVQNERILQIYEMIAELSETFVDMNDYIQASVEDIYNRQYNIEHSKRKARTINRTK